MTLKRFRWALEGMTVDPAGLPIDHRAYELAKRFHWTLDEIDEQSAERVDWLLAMAHTEDAVRAEREGKP